MSGRAASSPTRRRTDRAAKSFPALGLATALALAAGFALAGESAAQENVDRKSPLPPTDPQAAGAAEKYQIETNSAIFKRRNPKTGRTEETITDFEPVASEEKNPDEYQAWTAVVQHARQFPAAELERYARRDLTRDDLTTVVGGMPQFTANRLVLLRLDGKLLRVRRVEPSQALKLAGTDEVYEGLLLPLDEPTPAERDKALPYCVSVVFTELPGELASVRQKPVNEWADVDQWATAAGYFFKVKQDAAGGVALPILIGKSVTPLKAAPVAPGNNPAALDKDLRVFRRIEDGGSRPKVEKNWEEVSAWQRVLLHARRFDPETLERHATGELLFTQLFDEGRRDYKLDLVRFEGRLIRLTKDKPTDKLLAAGVENLYEGWIVPKDQAQGHPICVVFTDPPQGVEPVGRVNKWVTFAGYSFKLLRYTSGERDKDDPSKNVDKRAPLLLGRAVLGAPDPDGRSMTWGDFATGAIALTVLVAGFGVAVSWWFRRGDRQTRQEIAAHRGRNPFGEQAS